MKIKVPYGGGEVAIEVDKKNVVGVVNLNNVKLGDERKIVESALKNPTNSKPFEEFIDGAGNKEILIIVNDATRPSSASKIIPVIYDKIKTRNFKFIIATGSHRVPKDDEFRYIFGEYYPKLRDRVFVHESKKSSDMVCIGKAKDGSDAYVNKMVLEADRIVVIGSVEPHYFAGYTGGRKAFLPGVASYETITANHKYALDPKAETLALRGNPVHEGMEHIARLVKKEIFAVMVVLTEKEELYAATAGNIFDSFYAATKKADEIFSVKIGEKADIVVSVATPPQDKNLYQSQKAADNGKLALKKDGILILVAKCKDGIGEESFLQMMSRHSSPQELIAGISGGYKLGDHKAVKLAEISTWAQLWAVTGLKDEVVKNAFMMPFSDVREAIDEAIKEKGENAKILFLMCGSVSVPKVE
ncbi:MAG: nickel-dependent lactate racemase [Thermoplasmata archaeon]